MMFIVCSVWVGLPNFFGQGIYAQNILFQHSAEVCVVVGVQLTVTGLRFVG